MLLRLSCLLRGHDILRGRLPHRWLVKSRHHWDLHHLRLELLLELLLRGLLVELLLLILVLLLPPPVVTAVLILTIPKLIPSRVTLLTILSHRAVARLVAKASTLMASRVARAADSLPLPTLTLVARLALPPLVASPTTATLRSLLELLLQHLNLELLLPHLLL